jgi:hypothetical protein
LKRSAFHPLPLAILAIFLALFAAACSTPLAPGYQILKESREVQFVAAQPSELRVSSRYTLQNYGNGDLAFLDVVLPDPQSYATKNLRVEVDGRAAKFEKLPAGYQDQSANTFRITFDSPWTRKQKCSLSIEYSLASPEDSGPLITLSENAFHLGSHGWFPGLEPPKHVLSPHPGPPARTLYSVRVPSNFLVLGGGLSKGRKNNAGEVQYTFELRNGDPAPYVVAGRYVDSSANRKSGPVVFWTLEPLKDDPAAAEQAIADAWGTLQRDFGPLDKNIRLPHIVESPGLRSSVSGQGAPAAASFPGGALVNPQALALGVNGGDFAVQVTQALAHGWFNQVYPSPNAAIGMGQGLPAYATIVIDEARNGEAARRRRVQQFLREYDDACGQAVEKPLVALTAEDPVEQRRIGLAKAPLFFIALEDAYGPQPIRSGLAQLLFLLRGQSAGYDDLRSALEQSTGKNLAPVFRSWLYQQGIPAEFSKRYEAAAVETE